MLLRMSFKPLQGGTDPSNSLDKDFLPLDSSEPNLNHERTSQSTGAFLSFPDFYSPFKAGEGIRLSHVIVKCLT